MDYVHVVRRFDSGRREWFYLYRFDFDKGLQQKIKEEIPAEKRFWGGSYKTQGDRATRAWHIQEAYAGFAETLITDHLGQEVCPTCLRGSPCPLWSHLEDSWIGGPRQKANRPRSETAGERQGAQSRYEEWTRERHKRKDQRRHSEQGSSGDADDFWDNHHRQQDQARYGPFGQGAHERQQDQARYGPFGQGESEYSRQYRAWREESEVGSEKNPPEEPPKEDRWQDPGRRFRDSKWALRVLGLEKLPSREELKTEFRRLAMEFHPDRVEGDHEKMALINSARDYLNTFIA